jgi:hypothetical protein
MNELDLSIDYIAKLNSELQKQNKDIYSFLKEKFPDMAVEDRLKYLATILNDFFDEYEFDENDEFSSDGYIIKRFYPKGKGV